MLVYTGRAITTAVHIGLAAILYAVVASRDWCRIRGRCIDDKSVLRLAGIHVCIRYDGDIGVRLVRQALVIVKVV